MKQLKLNIAVILVALLPFMLAAQNKPVDKLFNKYSNEEGMTSVDISKGLFELFAEIDTDDEGFDDFKKAIEGLESLRLLACTKTDSTNELKEEFYSDIKKSVPFDEYKELMIIKDKDETVMFYAKNSQQIITEMLMVVDSNDEVVLLSLLGELDLNYVSKLGTSMNMGGMHYLSKMKK